MAKGYAETDIVVDVILTLAANLKDVDAANFHAIGLLFRYLEISSYNNSMENVLRAQFAYPKVTFRNIIEPSSSVGCGSMYAYNDK